MSKYNEDNSKTLCKNILNKIKELTDEKINIMEVCGTHTVAIFRSGLRELLPKNINLISGPGCPVCVTPTSEIDHIIALARMKNTIIVTFGDMINVPGTNSSLKIEKAKGANIQIIYSPIQCLEIAVKNPNQNVVLIGIGFETTTPLLASVVLEAAKDSVPNFYFFSLAKLMPPIMRELLQKKDAKLDGFLCPGHVSAIIGTEPYQFIPSEYHIPCVIAGFEPEDILIAIYHIVLQKRNKVACVENGYKRVVRKEGNPTALEKMSEVFTHTNSSWRGIGIVAKSGLDLKEKYRKMNARNFEVDIEKTQENHDCRCGDVLKGVITPLQCPLFRKVCTPENPIGACMVSSEGSCAAFYKYSTESLVKNI